MRVTVLNAQMLETVIQDMRREFSEVKRMNVVYEKAHKPKTGAQLGFLFSALISQITEYFRNCGFNVCEDDVKYKLYRDVSKIVPGMVTETAILGIERIRHVSEMDRELMSAFIDGIFVVLDQDPIYSGLKMTPDVYFNFLFHLDNEQIDFVNRQVFPERDPAYLDYLRGKPCMICGVQHRCQAHHLRDTRISGMAIKAPDWCAIPLCQECHMLVAHGTGFKEALSWVPVDLPVMCRVMYNRYLSKRG